MSFINIIILGKNIEIPIINAKKADVSTAPAALSLATLASALYFSVYVSTASSIAEFNNSDDITKIITRIILR